VLAAVLVTLLVVAGAQSRPTAGKTINIGWLGDKSGPTVSSQAPVLHALEAYFKMVNDAGGVNGDKINMIEKDDAYNPAKELELLKGLINDDKVVLVTGIGNSSAFASILPVLTASQVPGFANQGTLKSNTDPFQPWMFQGNCNYADQADVALGYEMTHLRLKTLKGVSVGVAGIAVASGQEWIEVLSDRIKKLGGTPVVGQLPNPLVNADVQVQAMQNAKVKFVLLHTSTGAAISFLKSMAKYQLDVPVSGSYSVTQSILYTQTPYTTAKFVQAVNCVSPPLYAKAAKGKLAVAMGKKYGYPESDYTQANWALGWVNAQIIVQALKNAKGNYTGASVKKGLEQIKNLDTGGLAPNVTLSATCHMALTQVRPYTYSYSRDALIPIGSFAHWSKFVTNAQAAPGTCGKR
jgi:branched-chain amino acid transport system substrate-binding protein